MTSLKIIYKLTVPSLPEKISYIPAKKIFDAVLTLKQQHIIPCTDGTLLNIFHVPCFNLTPIENPDENKEYQDFYRTAAEFRLV